MPEVWNWTCELYGHLGGERVLAIDADYSDSYRFEIPMVLKC